MFSGTEIQNMIPLLYIHIREHITCEAGNGPEVMYGRTSHIWEEQGWGKRPHSPANIMLLKLGFDKENVQNMTKVDCK